ncbi:MAG: DEAD/DEAH box helicase [Fimbriimonadaceae bacterium]|nr:DEAD/DEAH box helicase [Fimbriimonadaceae bacterium]
MTEETPKARRKRGLDKNETMVSGAMPGSAETLKWTPPPTEEPPTLGELVALAESELAPLAELHLHDLAAHPAKFLDPRVPLHPRLKQKLIERGLVHLFRHQAQAVDAAFAGKDIAVVTGTSSGKTLCYNLPVLHSCLSEPRVTALYLYPTKALAHDQLLKLEATLPGPDIRAGVYDGDTATATRALVRKNAHLILTNPDMLHLGILPQHETWGRFLKGLRFLVIDEMHVYRGILGSHVGGIIRRLLRLCEWYGSRPQIIACSATVANPTELFFNLTSRQPTIINEDGAPSGRKTLILVGTKAEDDIDDTPDAPFGLEGQKPIARPSLNQMSARLMAKLVEGRARTMAFCRARLSTELVLKMARKQLRTAKQPTNAIESYRSGYSPKERREIEKGLFGGTLRGLVTTNAMELGVDVGDLDAVILNGYPGSQASFWQQIGRAGRGGRDAVAVYMASDDPLEQFLVRRPARLLDADLEAATTNPSNPQILAQHLRCAAFERPISPSELDAFGPTAIGLAEELELSGDLVFSAGRFFYPSHTAPAPTVMIRGVSNDQIVLRAAGVEIGRMERWRALAEAHPGAIYLHRDKTYFVSSLNLPAGEATLEERNVDYYTQALAVTSIEPRVELRRKSPSSPDEGDVHREERARDTGGVISLAAVEACLSVTSYRRVSLETGENLGSESLELPITTFPSVAVRIDLPKSVIDKDPDLAVPSVHGLEHALLAVAPLIAGCERIDLASAWYVMYLETLAPCLFVFDRIPGGVGLAERLFESSDEWFEAALELLESCPCETGCPSCLLLPRCEVANQMLDKPGAIALLKLLLDRN